MQNEQICHPFQPIFNSQSKILILGSLPSVTSRKQNFYYSHSSNRFWKVLAGVFQVKVPETIEEKTTLLLSHQIALWDVIASCTITGSSDASIKNVVPNDLTKIFQTASIQTVICNGKAAEKYYRKYQLPYTHLEPLVLPSTSSANAAYSLEKLIQEYSKAL